MKTPTKPTRPKTPHSTVTGRGRVMWTHPDRLARSKLPSSEMLALRKHNFGAGTDGKLPIPVAIFDLSPEASAARVEAVAEAFYKEEEDWGWSMPWKSITGDCRTECLAAARAALKAIFPTHPTDKKGAK